MYQLEYISNIQGEESLDWKNLTKIHFQKFWKNFKNNVLNPIWYEIQSQPIGKYYTITYLNNHDFPLFDTSLQ